MLDSDRQQVDELLRKALDRALIIHLPEPASALPQAPCTKGSSVAPCQAGPSRGSTGAKTTRAATRIPSNSTSRVPGYKPAADKPLMPLPGAAPAPDAQSFSGAPASTGARAAAHSSRASGTCPGQQAAPPERGFPHVEPPTFSAIERVLQRRQRIEELQKLPSHAADACPEAASAQACSNALENRGQRTERELLAGLAFSCPVACSSARQHKDRASTGAVALPQCRAPVTQGRERHVLCLRSPNRPENPMTTQQPPGEASRKTRACEESAQCQCSGNSDKCAAGSEDIDAATCRATALETAGDCQERFQGIGGRYCRTREQERKLDRRASVEAEALQEYRQLRNLRARRSHAALLIQVRT